MQCSVVDKENRHHGLL